MPCRVLRDFDSFIQKHGQFPYVPCAENPRSFPAMKPNPRLRPFLLACGSLLALNIANGDTLYWDSNGATAGFGSANGTWGTSAFWSADSTGESATANTATTTADTVYFGTDTLGYTGGRTVTIDGTQDVNSIIFGGASGAVTLSGGTAINLGGGTPTITVNNATSTITVWNRNKHVITF